MTSTYTPNKNIEKPGFGDYSDDWNVPVNADWDVIDKALGNISQISVTGVSGTINLTTSQLQAMGLQFVGVLSANLTYVIPAGVGGQWIVDNYATGTGTITVSYASGGTSVAVPQSYVTPIYNDTNSANGVRLTNTNLVSTSNLSGTISATQGGFGTNMSSANGVTTWSSGTPSTSTPNYINRAPANPTATSSSTFVAMGLGNSGNVTFTPTSSGLVFVLISGLVGNSAASTNTFGGIYGVGNSSAAPTNGAAYDARTMTFLGNQIIVTPSSVGNLPVFCYQILSLTLGTTYWFDIALETSSALVDITSTYFTIFEIK